MKINELKKLIKESLKEESVLLSKPDLLLEASYARVKDKIENQMIPFVIITAFRGDKSGRLNLENQTELESRVRAERFSWTRMPGSGYLEDPGEEDGDPRQVKENSIIIWATPENVMPGEDDQEGDEGDKQELPQVRLKRLATKLAKAYEQDSYIYGTPVTKDGVTTMEIKVYDKEGNPINADWAGTWDSVSVIDPGEEYWSKIGSKMAQFKKSEVKEMLKKAKRMKVSSREDAMKKQYEINKIKEQLKRFE